MNPTVAFVGMTHLGLVSAVATASKGCRTIAADPDVSRISALNEGRLPVVEPGLPELLAEHRARLQFTADARMLSECDLIYIAPDVPVRADGASDTAPVAALLAWACKAARPNAVIVVLSQVSPGFTRRHEAPGLILYYQVETLIFGRAVERALHPERFIVGCSDPAAPLPAALQAYLGLFGCPILPMRYESAELAKISINLCLVAHLTITNTLAELCEGIGADWREIAPALRLDRRIGQYAYLGAGLGIGGGNLLRDVATASRLAAEAGTDASVLRSFEANSRHRGNWALIRLHEALAGMQKPRVAILGLAYKVDTAETLNSPGLALVAALGTAELRLHDPVVNAQPFGFAASDPIDACTGSDAVAIMTPWTAYRTIDIAAMARAMRGRVLLDPHGVLDAQKCAAAGLRRHVLGVPAP